MKLNVIAESGVIDAKGQFRLPMDRLNAFFAANKGKRVMVRFETAEPKTSAALFGYYYGYVVPTARDAFKELGILKTEDQTDRFLVFEYPGEIVKETAREFDQREMLEYLEWLKQYAAENLYVYIEDPKTI